MVQWSSQFSSRWCTHGPTHSLRRTWDRMRGVNGNHEVKETIVAKFLTLENVFLEDLFRTRKKLGDGLLTREFSLSKIYDTYIKSIQPLLWWKSTPQYVIFVGTGTKNLHWFEIQGRCFLCVIGAFERRLRAVNDVAWVQRVFCTTN